MKTNSSKLIRELASVSNQYDKAYLDAYGITYDEYKQHQRKLLPCPVVEEDDYGTDHRIACPNCGETLGLHHETVHVFGCYEDASCGVHAIVTKSNATIDDCLEGNPSKRRHGLSIDFSCEHCSESEDDIVARLHIAQHKGATNIHWEIMPKPTL